MKVCQKLLVIVLTATFIAVTFAEYNELCARFVDGMQFRQPGNCQAYVTCKNGTGTVTSCPKDKLYDKDSKKCVTSLSDSYCKEQCKNKDNKWIADPANCNGYFFCQSGKGLKGTCTDGYHFDESAQLCVFPQDSECIDISDFCGILPKSASFSDPNNCNKYFQCSKSTMKKTTCANGQYYEVASGKCKSKYEVTCKSHPIPTNACGKDSKPVYNKYVEDNASCRGYFYCAYKGPKISDKKPSWSQCAEGLFFNKDKQACYDPAETSCKHNRCEGRGNLKVIAEDFGCRHYYACEEGFVKEKRKCAKDMFFDESLQACTFKETFYSVCDF
ncbi:peritrophin-44-like [Episyrphus balteatus]|uniref:peritrophin-44-like n=1 Tax=Episyrphus balteatus TaxID=286459 RepID=UPI0024854AFC|nr:peritrophin-44-like [Episyrphus balteatus]